MNRLFLGHALVWIVVIATLVFLRYRGKIGWYLRLHAWADESGVPSFVPNLDNDILLVLLGLAIWATCARVGHGRSKGLLDDMGLRRGLGRGVVVGVVMCIPMLVLGAIVGTVRFEPSMLRIALVAPFAEEWFFRAVVVLAMVRLMGTSFWLAAIVGGVLFGAVHVAWSAQGLADGWLRFLVTGVGGVWYAWLAREWGRNLWVVIVAHALMNLGAAWHGTDAHPLSFEFGRAATIALGTIMTIRPRWFGLERPSGTVV